MDSMELANYLEKVRYGRKISQEKFVEGICSLRQYQRYRSGECEIPIEKIEAFARRLSIPSQKLLKEFEREKKEQDTLIDDFYNAVANQNLDRIKVLSQQIQKDIIIEEENRLYYKYTLIIDKRLSNRISKESAGKEISKLIDFPQIIKNSYFTDIEILILSTLLDLIDGALQKKLLNRLTDLFDTQENIMSGGNDLILSTILVRLSKAYGVLKDYGQVIHFCDLGLERGMHHRRFYLFDSFYYHKALAYYALEDYFNYEDSLFKCYSILQIEGNEKKIERYTSWIEKDFNINFNLFIINYLKKLYS